VIAASLADAQSAMPITDGSDANVLKTPKPPKPRHSRSKDQSARLNSSAASPRLRIKTNGKGNQESWTVTTTTKPATKGSKQTSFRVRVSDVGFRVCLVYYDDQGKRREPYLCYLSAKEWQQAKRGSLANFAKIISIKLNERRAKEDADSEKLEELLGRVKAFL